MTRRDGGTARGERGVALLAVLWMLAAAGTAAALGLAVVRDGVATSRYRSEYLRARWAAEGCLSEFRAGLERAFSGSGFSTASAFSAATADPWVGPRPWIPERCAISLTPPPDAPVDVNSAPEAVLRVLPGLGAEGARVVLRERAWGRRIVSLDGLIGVLPAELQGRVESRYGELVVQLAFAPPAWVVTSQGIVGGRTVPIVSERWVRVNDRVAVVQREIR